MSVPSLKFVMLNTFCGAPVEVWVDDNNDFDDCFEDTVVLGISSLYFWLFIIYAICTRGCGNGRRITHTPALTAYLQLLSNETITTIQHLTSAYIALSPMAIVLYWQFHGDNQLIMYQTSRLVVQVITGFTALILFYYIRDAVAIPYHHSSADAALAAAASIKASASTSSMPSMAAGPSSRVDDTNASTSSFPSSQSLESWNANTPVDGNGNNGNSKQATISRHAAAAATAALQSVGVNLAASISSVNKRRASLLPGLYAWWILAALAQVLKLRSVIMRLQHSGVVDFWFVSETLVFIALLILAITTIYSIRYVRHTISTSLLPSSISTSTSIRGTGRGSGSNLRLMVGDDSSDQKRSSVDSPRQRQLQQGLGDDSTTPITSHGMKGNGKRVDDSIANISWWSHFTFTWAHRLLRIGYRHQLDVSHTNPLMDIDATSSINARFASLWRVETKKADASLIRAFFAAFGREYVLLGCLKLLVDGLMFVGPVLLQRLVDFIEETPRHQSNANGYLYAMGLVLGVIASAICGTQFSFHMNRLSNRLRAAIITRIFEKSLSIADSAKRTFSSGQITNIMSVDTPRVQNLVVSFHELWSLPVQIGVALWLLYQQVGITLLAGVGVVILMIPINALLTKKIAAVSQRMMNQKDQRVELTNEMLHHIRVIKLMAYEPVFELRVNEVREEEMKSLRTRKYLDAFCVYFWATTPILVSLSTFSMYHLLGNRLTATKVFTSLALFNTLIRPLNAFPWVINGIVEGRISAVRLRSFLLAPDMKPDTPTTGTPSGPFARAQSSVPPPPPTVLSPTPMNSNVTGNASDVIVIDGTFSHVPLDTISDDARARLLASSPAALAARQQAQQMERSRTRSAMMGMTSSRTTSSTASSFGGFDPSPSSSVERQPITIPQSNHNSHHHHGAIEASSTYVVDHAVTTAGASAGGVTSTVVSASSAIPITIPPSSPLQSQPQGIVGSGGMSRNGSHQNLVAMDGNGNVNGVMSLPPSPSSARFTIDISSAPQSSPPGTATKATLPSSASNLAAAATQASTISSLTPSSNALSPSPSSSALNASSRVTNRQRTSSPLTRTPHLHVPVGHNGSSHGEDEEDEEDRTNRNHVALWNITVNVSRGQFIGVVGAVGSGKSSLLRAMLGELHCVTGVTPVPVVRGRVALVTQEAWIQNASVRDNILFGSPYDRRRYEDVIAACALVDDFKILPGGDMTEIGERGINVSGGQKIRISLARAVYQDCDIYLLDDPLSAIDVHVGQHIMQHCVNGLLANKTRVLVTHHIHVLAKADSVWSMAHGQITHVYHPATSTSDREQMEHIWGAPSLPTSSSSSSLPNGGLPRSGSSSPALVASDSKSKIGETKVTTPPSAKDDERNKKEKEAADAEDHARNALVVAEGRALGTIRSKVLSAYLGMVGHGVCGLILLSLITMQISRNFNDWWLGHWVNDTSGNEDNDAYYLDVLIYAGIANTFLTLFRAFVFAWGGLRAAQKLYQQLLSAILNAGVAFFDQNPVGRILNRFSSDMYAVDESIPFISNIFLAQSFGLLGSLTIISLTMPVILVMMLPLALVYYHLQNFYRCASRELRRLDSVSRSPIYTKFSETLSGVMVIRAFGAQERFAAENERIVDDNQRVSFASLGTSNWLAFRLQLIGICVVCFVSFFSVIETIQRSGSVNPALVGLALAYALPLTDNLNGLIGSFADTEKEVVSVERAVEYLSTRPEETIGSSVLRRSATKTKKKRNKRASANVGGSSSGGLGREASHDDIERSLSSSLSTSRPRGLTDPLLEPFEPETVAVSEAWPRMGEVAFDEVTLQYRAGLEPALNRVSFRIRSGEHIGIVGRTGAGKSSLFEALFRMRSETTGRIVIDGVDTSMIPRRTLRQRLSIIPQAPVVFTGTVRWNLDPARQYSDDALWMALAKCAIADKIRSLPHQLEEKVSENANNFSVGERQLLCMARALLRQARVIALDEATASVDMATDAAIGRVCAREFKERTLLIIAHRIDTVLGCDRVMVMQHGRVVEFDRPVTLLARSDSLFTKLVDQAHASKQGKSRTSSTSASSSSHIY